MARNRNFPKLLLLKNAFMNMKIILRNRLHMSFVFLGTPIQAFTTIFHMKCKLWSSDKSSYFLLN